MSIDAPLACSSLGLASVRVADLATAAPQLLRALDVQPAPDVAGLSTSLAQRNGWSVSYSTCVALRYLAFGRALDVLDASSAGREAPWLLAAAAFAPIRGEDGFDHAELCVLAQEFARAAAGVTVGRS